MSIKYLKPTADNYGHSVLLINGEEMFKPSISVIIPVYNVEKYLRRCLDSVLNQSFDNFELIIVNDGSTDSCSSICDEYEKKDERIVVIHQDNKGISAARNAGLDYIMKYSTSKYIVFVDSDDWVDKDYLSSLYSYRNFDITMVSYFFHNGKIIDHPNPWTTEKHIILDKNEYWMNYFKKDSITGAVVWNKMFKKSLFKNIHFKCIDCEDEYFLNDIMMENISICYVNKSLYHYRLRENSLRVIRRDSTYFLNKVKLYLNRLSLHEIFDSSYYYSLTIQDALAFYLNALCSLNKKQKKDILQLKKIIFKNLIIKKAYSLKYLLFWILCKKALWLSKVLWKIIYAKKI